MNPTYDSKFYDYHREYSHDSAIEIVPNVISIYPINSIIDIGCGSGAWLKIFQEKGVNIIRGYDISDLTPEEYFVNKEYITTNFDFTRSDLIIDRNFDLLICLELVEHLPESNAEKFIEKITGIAPVILFSAAIPGQMGSHHVNEQLPGYWRNLFNQYDFIEIDFLKPLIWKNLKVAWWYRQNITMYVKKIFLDANQSLLDLSLKYPQLPEDQNLVLVSERILRQYNQTIIQRFLHYISLKFGRVL